MSTDKRTDVCAEGLSEGHSTIKAFPFKNLIVNAEAVLPVNR